MQNTTTSTNEYFKNCSTLDEAKKLYYKLAIQLHPDKGGKKEDFQKMLNQFHAFKPSSQKFNTEFEQWDSKKYADIVEQLIKIKGIDIIICGSWIWLEGDTKPVKEQIKSINLNEYMKRGFSRSKGQWYFSPIGYKKRSGKVLSYERIKDLYGAKNANDQDNNQLQTTF